MTGRDGYISVYSSPPLEAFSGFPFSVAAAVNPGTPVLFAVPVGDVMRSRIRQFDERCWFDYVESCVGMDSVGENCQGMKI